MATAKDKFSVLLSLTSSKFTELYRHYFGEVCTVDIKSGQVKGFKIASSFDYDYFNFHGIPYANPPIGELRFKVSFWFTYLRFQFFHKI